MSAVLVPHSLEFEQAVLGGLLLDPEGMDRVAMDGSEFFSSTNRIIFKAIRTVQESGAPVDLLTLNNQLEKEGHLDQVGGIAYLATLMQNTPSAANIHHYAEMVKGKALERRLMAVAEEIRALAVARDETVENKLRQAEDLITQLSSLQDNGGRLVHAKSALVQAVEGIDERFSRDGEIMGLPTGFSDLDDMTSGMQKGDLVIVAGRPSMGKTAFAMNVAEKIILHGGGKGLIFSLEMNAVQLINRMISGVGKIDAQRLRSGNLMDSDWENLTLAVSKISSMPLWIDESSAVTPSDIRASVRKTIRALGGLDFIVIDYLQLMTSVSRKQENRATEISEISRALKAIAKEFNIAVIALSQLNRAIEQRANKRPVMSDLRESGAIEQDADVILFIYRDEVYDPDSQDKGVAEIIIGKQRNGPIGTVRLTFTGGFARFEKETRIFRKT